MYEVTCLSCDQADGVCGHTGKCRDCAGECIKCDHQQVINLAIEAFWSKIAELTPKVTSGDLSPEIVSRFEEVATAAVYSWHEYNQHVNSPCSTLTSS